MRTIKCVALLLLVCGFWQKGQAQKADKGDYYWNFVQFEWPGQPIYKGFALDFEREEVKVNTIESPIQIDGTNSTFCDENGRMLMYTNGVYIVDSTYQKMENGDSISTNSRIKAYTNYYITGYPLSRITAFLPFGNDSYKLLMLLPDTITIEGVYTVRNRYLTSNDIKFDEAHPKGRVTKKEDLIWSDTLIGWNVTACRHANGRDWWFITQRDARNILMKFLISPDSVRGPWYQEFPLPDHPFYNGNSVFSPDGTKFYHLDGPFGIQLYDFDRCTGELSNFRYFHDLKDVNVPCDIAISPNSRYLYMVTGKYVKQYDLATPDVQSFGASVDTVGVLSPATPGNFGRISLAPDRKMYINSSNAAYSLSVIHYPDRKGKACRLVQGALKVPYMTGGYSINNFPDYRLGPEAGSECDSLGLAKGPVARFRINHDSLDSYSKEFTDLSFRNPTEWSWSFGDGGSSSEREPVHVYASKGVYEVCLTVSNAYGSDTYCKHTGIWPLSTTEQGGKEIALYPNPANQSITIDGLTGEPCQIAIRSIFGYTLKKLSSEGTKQLEINIQDLPAGFYILDIMSSNNDSFTTKFIK
ncbi:MAG TPA: PKD domain-containing protein, partial [Saprospiraceae bacterium]|nr:PKD domain-containing protein [Saprospiraceae bacterium]